MNTKKPSWLVLFSLYAIYFLDLAGLAIVFVIFAPLIIESNSLLSPDVSISQRNIILGFLLATYPLTQFLGAPILGELSDRFGRKWPLFFSSLFTAFTFLLSALSLQMESLSLLFISRLLAGFSAGNMTITQASIGDLVEEKKRPRYMAFFNIVGGVSWTIAPFLGSILSNPNNVSWFSQGTPFAAIGILFLILSFLVLAKFQTTGAVKKGGIKIIRIFKDLIRTLELPTISPLLLTSVLTVFGWMMYQGFMAAYLNQKYQFSQDWIGITFSYFSGWWFVGGLLANQWLLKKFHASHVNLIPMLIVPFAVLSFSFFSDSLGMWFATPFSNGFASLASSCFFSLFSTMAHPDIQGKVFGFYNAGFALSSFLCPIIGGLLAAYNIDFPFIAAFILLLAAFFFYWKWFSHHKRAASKA